MSTPCPRGSPGNTPAVSARPSSSNPEQASTQLCPYPPALCPPDYGCQGEAGQAGSIPVICGMISTCENQSFVFSSALAISILSAGSADLNDSPAGQLQPGACQLTGWSDHRRSPGWRVGPPAALPNACLRLTRYRLKFFTIKGSSTLTRQSLISSSIWTECWRLRTYNAGFSHSGKVSGNMSGGYPRHLRIFPCDRASLNNDCALIWKKRSPCAMINHLCQPARSSGQ